MSRSNLARKIDVARAQAAAPGAAPARTSTAPKPATEPPNARLDIRRVVLAIAVAILLAINTLGAGYYTAPMAVRVRHPLHAWLRPSGYVGQSAGILAFGIFAFLWLYPLRKKYRALAWTGSVGRWLDVHVASALTLPLLLAIHAAWQFDGVIGLGYTAIMLVCASGVVGRYLYARIPRARSGVELTMDEVAAQRASLIGRISATTRLAPAAVEQALSTAAPPASKGIGRSLVELVAGDFLRWRRIRQLRRHWAVLGPPGLRPSRKALDEAMRLASREMALAQQVRFLSATHQVFRWWHVAHRPVAITALIAVVIHIAVVVAVGATWIG